MSTVFPLHTERLVLRAFAEDDLDALYDMHRRPEVTEFLLSDTRTRGEVREMLKRRISQTDLVKEGDNLAVAVVVRESGALIGDFNLELVGRGTRPRRDRVRAQPDARGRGYATEAGGAMLRLAFEHFGFHRVIGDLQRAQHRVDAADGAARHAQGRRSSCRATCSRANGSTSPTTRSCGRSGSVGGRSVLERLSSSAARPGGAQPG